MELQQLVGRAPAWEPEQLREVTQRAPGRERARGCASHLRRSRARADEPAGDLDERRLACAVRPEQADELALPDLEIDPRECRGRAVALRQPADCESGRHASSLRVGSGLQPSPSRCGWPSIPSSAMSRWKKSDVVQSVTTRSFRDRSGSWYRWYVRGTNQPRKPRRRIPSTSAIPL